MKVKYALFFLISLCYSVVAQSQTYKFRTYTVEDGLSRSEVLSILQDTKGYMWFGTAGGGVSRFDGRSFVTINTRDGLLQNDVHVIFEDSQQRLWFGTNAGVSCYTNGKFHNYTKADGMAQGAIEEILQDKQGNLWFRSLEHGVSMLNKATNKLIAYSTFNGLPNDIVTAMHQDSKGNMWLATFRGLVMLPFVNGSYSNKFSIFTIANGLADNKVSSIVEDKQGQLWFGTWGGGISKYTSNANGNLFVNYSIDKGLGSPTVLNMLLDEDGSIWVATLLGGVAHFVNGTFTSYGSGQFLNTDFVNKLKQDSEHNLWFIASDESLHIIKALGSGHFATTIRSFSPMNGLSDDRVKAICEDREGNLWLGTQKGGVCRYNGDGFVYYTAYDGLLGSSVQGIAPAAKNTILHITSDGVFRMNVLSGKVVGVGTPDFFKRFNLTCGIEDAEGRVWAGSKDNGVFLLQGNKVTQFNKEKALPSNNIRSIYQDKHHTIWVCTDDGLAQYTGGSSSKPFKIFKSQLKEQSLVTTLEMGTKKVFIGDGNIIEIYDGKTFKHIDVPYTLSGAGVVVNENEILLGTEGDGLLLMNINAAKPEAQIYIKAQDINNTAVNAMVLDNNQRLWIGTSNGFFCYADTHLNSQTPKNIRYYGREDGLISVVSNKNSVFADNSGNVWFGTAKGSLKITQSAIRSNNIAPQVSIQAIRLYFENKDLREYATGIDSITHLPTELRLPYNYNHLTFDFFAISHTNPEKVKYQYQMQGDKEWSPLRKETFAIYSNLSPGTYTFKVMAANNDGVLSKTFSSFKFTILSPYWRTWWFITLCIFIIGGLLLTFFLWRIRSIKSTAGLKQRIAESEQKALRAQMNPHFIFNSLNSIQHFITDKDVKSANRYLSKFSKLMRMILDNSKSHYILIADELESLNLYLELESLRFEDKFEYSIEIDSDIDVYSVEMPPMLLQPYLENAIWHGLTYKTEKGKIIIRLKLQGENLICEIEDNGIGRKKAEELKVQHPAHKGSSGMLITSERLYNIALLKNSEAGVSVTDLTNEQGEGTGTLVTIKIPID